jgi:phage tail sheath protein FI
VGKALEEATVTIPASDGYQKSTFNDLGLEEAEKLRAKLRECLLVHYPSAIVAAAYSATDRNRGVWKAPANIWMDGVSGVTPRLTHSQMEQLFQPLEGCTVNMLKAQPGYGTFIWGARTLQGGDGDSAFVNVRRLMDYVEQKLMEVTTFAVFEPNVEMTWVTVKGMCDALMNELWEAGALVGKTREEAWRSEVGLGTTMTQEDILNGRLILEVKVAPVRPAEFILLKIVHQVTAMAVGST